MVYYTKLLISCAFENSYINSFEWCICIDMQRCLRNIEKIKEKKTRGYAGQSHYVYFLPFHSSCLYKVRIINRKI